MKTLTYSAIYISLISSIETFANEDWRMPNCYQGVVNLVDENCLPDNIKLDSLGRLVTNPVGGPGAVSCEVEMTDADDRTIRKTIHLSSGL